MSVNLARFARISAPLSSPTSYSTDERAEVFTPTTSSSGTTTNACPSLTEEHLSEAADTGDVLVQQASKQFKDVALDTGSVTHSNY
jgi:hypothetical protein